MPDHLTACKAAISEMLRRSQTKVIFPLITIGLLNEFTREGTTGFSHADVRRCYKRAVAEFAARLGHDLHIGGRYETAYSSRSLPRYGVLRSLPDERFELTQEYRLCASPLAAWIPEQIEEHIRKKLGIIPSLGSREFRSDLADRRDDFLQVMSQHMGRNPADFEVFSFAILKVHLEKFACRIYRDSRTAAHDRGVDLSTNFGVVYQIKKLKVLDRRSADAICAELRLNFDEQRFEDGKVILIIDDVAKDVRSYLIDMKVQAISKDEIVRLAANMEDVEDREKVLRVVYEEFSREYRSSMSPQAG